MATQEQIQEQKEHLKETYQELQKLSEEDRLTEFASLVYAKITIKRIAEQLKEHFKTSDELLDGTEKEQFVKDVAVALSTYAVIGLEMGYAREKGKDDAVSE